MIVKLEDELIVVDPKKELLKANKCLLREKLKKLEMEKEVLQEQIVRTKKKVKYLSDLLDKGENAFYFSQRMFWIRCFGLLSIFVGAVWLVFLFPNKFVIKEFGAMGLLIIGFFGLFFEGSDFSTKLSFYLFRSSVAGDIVKRCSYLDEKQNDLKKIEEEREVIAADLDGELGSVEFEKTVS